jgi:hypothetical protein
MEARITSYWSVMCSWSRYEHDDQITEEVGGCRLPHCTRYSTEQAGHFQHPDTFTSLRPIWNGRRCASHLLPGLNELPLVNPDGIDGGPVVSPCKNGDVSVIALQFAYGT